MLRISMPRLAAPLMVLAICILPCLTAGSADSATAQSPSHDPRASIAMLSRSVDYAQHTLASRISVLRRCQHAHPTHCKRASTATNRARRHLEQIYAHLSRQIATGHQVTTQTAPEVTVSGDTLSWKKIANVSDYIVMRSVPGATVTYATVAGTSTTPTPAPGTTVGYRVRTQASQSAWSAEVRISYPVAPPASPSTPSTTESSSASKSAASPPTSTEEVANHAEEDHAESPTAPVLTITGTTYYVSAHGSDRNSGTSPAEAWLSVKRVNEAKLAPGDAVLFEGGASFSDETLMPSNSGGAGEPIVFGSYGTGNATLPQGVWFKDVNYLAFDGLNIGPEGNLQGTGNGIIVEHCAIGNDSLAINATGNNSEWAIVDNTINNTGNSGMLLEGEHFTVSGNTITNTGLNTSIPYGKHGIYLKVADATVTDNTISNFSADGISVRYRNSTVVGNHISDGPIGIAWFQADTIAGKSYWAYNVITDTTEAGIYVSSSSNVDEQTIESFTIEHNTIQPASGVFMNLHEIAGTYTVAENSLL